MKKILLLGGACFQIPAIQTAKRMGLYTILCDYLPDNPGQRFADAYCPVDTTDKGQVLAVAKEYGADGILSYASDVAAPTAAYVAAQLGFPGSPPASVEILCRKDLFRAFLRENRFPCPASRSYMAEEAGHFYRELPASLHFPLMVKPADSSGSKGVHRAENREELAHFAQDALRYSRCRRFIVEECVEKQGFQIGGDGFSVDGKLAFSSFGCQHFDGEGGRPFVPIAETWPDNLAGTVRQKLRAEIQRALSLLRMGTQAYNFEALIHPDGSIYLIEIGPRNGGNFIPQVLHCLTGADTVEYSIRAAMGMDCAGLSAHPPRGFWSNYILYARKEGFFQGIWIDGDFGRKHLYAKRLLAIPGSLLRGEDLPHAVAVLFLRFSSQEEMLEQIPRMNRYARVCMA